MKHTSVLLKEAVDLLEVKPDGLYVDGTLGRGGHSREILKKLADGHLYAFDLDAQAIKESQANLKDYQNITYIHDNFAKLSDHLKAKVDGILLDLGVSSPQLDDEQRGFAYRFDAPLDMRMDQSQKQSAYDIINYASEAELVRIIRTYGEEPYAKAIAKAIVKKRPLKTTFELTDVIKSALPAKVLKKPGHPAKQTFQALRIAVNHELDSLETFLKTFDPLLKKDGRVVIITFHSLEDRLVKQAFKSLSEIKVDKHIPYLPQDLPKARYQLLTPKAILPSSGELDTNHRSKSAKLRAIKKLGD